MNDNLRINDIPINERPIEKLLKFGVEGLTNAELIAILLRSGTKGENIISLSTRLLSEVNGLDGLLNISLKELTSIRGIKEVKGCQIIAMIEIFKRFNTLKSSRKMIKVSSPKDIATLLINEMSELNQEVLKAIFLNTKNIIIAHNHPSGDPNPSKEDMNITIRLKECGNIMGIKVIDHIVIGYNKYISLKEKGIM